MLWVEGGEREWMAYRLEHGGLLVASAKGPHVVDGDAGVLLHQGSVETAVCHLRDSPEGAVLGRLEIDGRRPVVTKILGHLAGSTLGCLGGVDRAGVHLG